MSQSRTPGTDEHVYTLTTYVAAPGTPIIDPSTGLRSESLPGHMYYSVSDGVQEYGYGFAPKGHGRPIGQGEISTIDFQSYQNPVYSRTIEVTREQYDRLREFGEAGLRGEQTHFNLTYNGATNSCIDFTWGALNHAGLHRQLALPNGQSAPLTDYDGRVLPEGNIAALQTLRAPFPDSTYNRVETNPAPPGWVEKVERAKDEKVEQYDKSMQRGLKDMLCEAVPSLPLCPNAGASVQPGQVSPDPRDPASPDHLLYKQIEAGVARIDTAKGRSSDGLSERLTMSALTDAKAAGLGSADHVALNEAGRKPRDDGTYALANSQLIAIEGKDPADPAATRSVTDVAQAVERPVEQSLQRVEALNQQQTQLLAQQQLQQQPQQQTQDGPSHGSRTM
mgnify:CR=1 FL=1